MKAKEGDGGQGQSALRRRGLENAELILAELVNGRGPLSAYEILAAVRDRGRDLRPVSVYRVLARLVSQGLVHRVETLGAFVACSGCHTSSGTHAFVVCSGCRTVVEFEVDPAVGRQVAVNTPEGFTPRTICLEVSGLCSECMHAQPAKN